MNVLLDSSVLVAGHLPGHAAYGACRLWLECAKQHAFELHVAAHSLAESYSVLTRIHATPPISPSTAWQFLEQNVLSCCQVISLSSQDYRDLLSAAAQQGFAGGIVYDAIIAKAAEMAQVDYLITLNEGHFQRVWPAASSRILSPAAMTPPTPPAIPSPQP